jgi:coenzyme Q-binding protein COQ10
MHSHSDTQQSPYSPQQIFDLVIDIERYPEFLPWCRAARVLERREGSLTAELVVSFKHITESYVSEVTYTRPQAPDDEGRIDVRLLKGPFKRLENHWVFSARPGGGTEIGLHLAFQFRSKLLDSLIGLLFGKASARMALAFKQRADALYGGKP